MVTNDFSFLLRIKRKSQNKAHIEFSSKLTLCEKKSETTNFYKAADQGIDALAITRNTLLYNSGHGTYSVQ